MCLPRRPVRGPHPLTVLSWWVWATWPPPCSASSWRTSWAGDLSCWSPCWAWLVSTSSHDTWRDVSHHDVTWHDCIMLQCPRCLWEPTLFTWPTSVSAAGYQNIQVRTEPMQTSPPNQISLGLNVTLTDLDVRSQSFTWIPIPLLMLYITAFNVGQSTFNWSQSAVTVSLQVWPASAVLCQTCRHPGPAWCLRVSSSSAPTWPGSWSPRPSPPCRGR